MDLLLGVEGEAARIRRSDAAREDNEVVLPMETVEAKLVLTDALIAKSLRRGQAATDVSTATMDDLHADDADEQRVTKRRITQRSSSVHIASARTGRRPPATKENDRWP